MNNEEIANQEASAPIPENIIDGAHALVSAANQRVGIPSPSVVGAAVTKCKIEDHFSLHFIALIKSSPTNPVVVGHITSTLKQQPPAEAVTFELIRDWIEARFGRTIIKPCNPVLSNPLTHRQAMFSINFNVEHKEYGTAKYTCTRASEIEKRISIEEIKDALENGSDIRDIIDVASESEDEHEIDSSCCDYNYSDEEPGDSEFITIMKSESNFQIRACFVDFLVSNGRQDLVDKLEENE